MSTYCDTLCYDMWAHIVGWKNHTPNFESTAKLSLSPLAMLVALRAQVYPATHEVERYVTLAHKVE